MSSGVSLESNVEFVTEIKTDFEFPGVDKKTTPTPALLTPEAPNTDTWSVVLNCKLKNKNLIGFKYESISS